MGTRIRISQKGSSHFWISHPLLSSVLPAGGRVKSGTELDLPYDDVARDAFDGCGIDVIFLDDEEAATEHDVDEVAASMDAAVAGKERAEGLYTGMVAERDDLLGQIVTLKAEHDAQRIKHQEAFDLQQDTIAIQKESIAALEGDIAALRGPAKEGTEAT